MKCRSAIYVIFSIFFATGAFAQVPNVVINEIMYDDTATSGLSQIQWIELHNTTGSSVNIGNWIITDASGYPPGTEGAWRIPVGTSIPANGYAVLANQGMLEIAGEIVCDPYFGTVNLGTSGDNIALYTLDTGGSLIDGSASTNFPDLSPSNSGYSLEKCNENSGWSGASINWHASLTDFAATGRYRRCTPGAANSPCPDTTPPAIDSVFAVSSTQLDVYFNEVVEQVSAETEGNYVVDLGIGSPLTALRDGTLLSLVHLTYNPIPNNGYQMTVNGVRDMSNNAAVNRIDFFTVNFAGGVTGIILSEVMYDDTGAADFEWVEIYNRNATAVDISNWVLIDASNYPPGVSEGGIRIPASTSIPAGAYRVLALADLPGITGEIICTMYDSTFDLNNAGDNLALYDLQTGGSLVDGSLSVSFPDIAPTDFGYSIEKCHIDSAWSNDPAAWHISTNSFGTGRYRRGTPGAVNTTCISDAIAPTVDSVHIVNNLNLDIHYSEIVDLYTSQALANYAISNGVGNPASATRQGDQRIVRLTFAAPLAPNAYSVTINNVEDVAANRITNNTTRLFTISAVPDIDSVVVVSTTQLNVFFNASVQQASAEIESNYSVNLGVGNPLTALRDGSVLRLVHLTFNPLPANTYLLTVNGVTDLAGNVAVNRSESFVIGGGGGPSGVVITEVMYDDTGSTDLEWVEIHNTTGAAIDISGWVMIDAASYPPGALEGGIQIPASTSIPAGAYRVLARTALPEIAGEIVCTMYDSTFELNDASDNLALYSAATGGSLVDGSLSVSYPDLAPTNLGYSIEKCNVDSIWSGNPSSWHISTNSLGVGRYRRGTPGAVNTACISDAIEPTVDSVNIVNNLILDVHYSEIVELYTSQTLGNYAISNGVGNPATATRQGDQRIVRLTFASPLVPNAYSITINNVEDIAANRIPNNTTRLFTIPSVPDIDSVVVVSATQLNVYFNASVQQTSAEIESNYVVNLSVGSPLTALRDGSVLRLVHLTFNPLPANTYQLTVNGVQDLAGNVAVNRAESFTVVGSGPTGVVITEVMYDDSNAVDREWVEIHNTTASAIDISGWVLIDAANYPPGALEGGIQIPASTSIPAGGYLVLSSAAIPEFAGEIVCTMYDSTFDLNDASDNLALYSALVGGSLVDGSLSVSYPDLAPTNLGYSIEKCNVDSMWSGNPASWHVSENALGTGRYRRGTPGAANTVCTGDAVVPTFDSVVVVTTQILRVYFSENVDLNTSQTVSNYVVGSGIGIPASAIRQTDNRIVNLNFSAPMPPNTYALTINNVEDIAANRIANNSSRLFTIDQPANIKFSEVMPNPNFADAADSSGEWFEVYNGGGLTVSLTNWVIADAQGSDTIEGSVSIAPGQYFVFAARGDSIGNGGIPENYDYKFGTSGWGLSLSNTGEALTLRNHQSAVVSQINYTGFPYAAGRSAQLKDVSYNPAVDTSWCQAYTPWNGGWSGDWGTPRTSSLCPDVYPPDLISVTVNSNTSLDLLFNETVNGSSAAIVAHYFVDLGGGNPQSANRDLSNLSLVHLTYTPLPPNLYTMTVNGLEDNSENACVNETAPFIVNPAGGSILALIRSSDVGTAVTALNAGTLECPDTLRQWFRLRNFGGSALNFNTPFTVVGPHFYVTTTCAGTIGLNAGQVSACSLAVTFSPQSAGSWGDTLNIPTNAGNAVGGVIRLPLSGGRTYTLPPPSIVIRRSGSNIVLSWFRVRTSAGGCPATVDQYHVESASTFGGTYSSLGTTADSTYTHTGAVPAGALRFYQVTAIDN